METRERELEKLRTEKRRLVATYSTEFENREKRLAHILHAILSSGGINDSDVEKALRYYRTGNVDAPVRLQGSAA